MKGWYYWPPVVWADEAWKNLRRRFQRFCRGWATQDALEFSYWFTETIPPMLEKLAEHTKNVPEGFSEDAWVAKLHELADEARLLNTLDWQDFVNTCGRVDWRKAHAVLDDRIKHFFAEFAKYFQEMNW